MKRFTPLIVSLFVALFVVAAVGKPDLIITGISLTPSSPVAGNQVTITATVKNVGTSPADQTFSVRFLIDGFPIGSGSISFGLKPGVTKSATITWTAEVGTHTITAQADQPFDKIDESNEQNNVLVATVVIPVNPAVAAKIAGLRVVVARFDDRSTSGFVNVGAGVADELINRLADSGVHVLERGELESLMQKRNLNPSQESGLVAAARLLGADLLIVGAVTKMNVTRASLSLGFFQVSSATAEVGMTARLINVYTSTVVKSVSASGSEQGTTGFSVDLGKILSLTKPTAADVCLGGFRTDRPYYFPNETVHIGYRNPGPARWYGVEIHKTGGPFLKWLGWQFIPNGKCGEWFWDQRNASNAQMGAGFYTAKLWDGATYLATTEFQIRPGTSPAGPLIDEVTVGSPQFANTIVGRVVSHVVNQLTARLIDGMAQVASQIHATRSAPLVAAPAPLPRVGQVAAILPDGRVVINIGANVGVHKGDFFQVLATENLITDPTTGKVLSYDVRGVKGEIVIVSVRDQVAYGVKTSQFNLLVGDVVRPSS